MDCLSHKNGGDVKRVHAHRRHGSHLPNTLTPNSPNIYDRIGHEMMNIIEDRRIEDLGVSYS
jgi:hypothetical protein